MAFGFGSGNSTRPSRQEGMGEGFNYKHLFEMMMSEFDTVFYLDEERQIVSFVKVGQLFGFLQKYSDLRRAYKEFKNRIYPEDLKLVEAFNPMKDKRFFAEMRVKKGKEYVWSFIRLTGIGEHGYFIMLQDLSGSTNKQMQMKQEYLNRLMNLENTISILRQKYRAVTDHADILVFEYDLETRKISVDSNLQNKYTFAAGYCQDIDRFIASDLIYESDKEILYAIIQRLGSVDSVYCNIRMRNDQGEYFSCNVYLYGVYGPDGRLTKVTGSVKDESVDSHKKSYTLCEGVDKLTGLHDTDGFYAKIDELLSEPHDNPYAVIVFDITNFKYIDQLNGVDFADNVLKYIAFRLSSDFEHKNCACAHFWGDHFAVVTDYSGDEHDLIELTERISSEINCYKSTNLRYTFGIYKIENKLIPPRVICDCATIAKRSVKANHLRAAAFYSDYMRRKILDDIIIENDMEKALETGQFAMYLQPKYDIGTGDAVGAEALVRWLHPVKGMIRPDSFIPLFERNGFIVKLDRYIWEQACKLIARWQADGAEPVPISVNVSRINLLDSETVDVLNELVDRYKIDKKYLELEITETAYNDDASHLVDILGALKVSGFKLLMDDFGSGFSSLSMLKNTPFDTLKIDRNFLNETMINDKGKKIILHAIRLANDIGLDIVAEGVETKEQAEYLLECGCNTAQGYYYSKPVPIPDFECITGIGRKEDN